MSTILLVEDDAQLVRTLQTFLTGRGYTVLAAGSGEDALDLHRSGRPDLILLDLGLPGMDGLDVIRQLREQEESQTPVVVISARDQEREKVRALDLGADDYLTKPFGVEELLARIRVALRHAGHQAARQAHSFRYGDLEVDLDLRRVVVRGQDVHLRPKEYDLLVQFVTHPDKVLTHRWLLQRIWGPEYGDEGHYIHVHVASLRQKLEPDPQQPRHLVTEPGVGYRFHAD